MTYTTSTFVGGDLDVIVKITNRGKRTSKPIHFQFGSLKDHADLVGCNPACSKDEFLGDTFTRFTGGIRAGKTKTFTVRWLATDVGVATWSLDVYEVRKIFRGEGSTTIR